MPVHLRKKRQYNVWTSFTIVYMYIRARKEARREPVITTSFSAAKSNVKCSKRNALRDLQSQYGLSSLQADRIARVFRIRAPFTKLSTVTE